MGFGIIAKEFIVLAIGEKWLVSAEYLQWLCVCGAIAPISVLLADLVISKGKSGTFMGCTLALGLLEILAMLLLYPYGISMMVKAYVAINLIWLFVWFFAAIKADGEDVVAVMQFTRYFTAYVADSLLFIGNYATLWLLLVSRVVLAALLYFLVMKAAHAKILDETLHFFTNKLKH